MSAHHPEKEHGPKLVPTLAMARAMFWTWGASKTRSNHTILFDP